MSLSNSSSSIETYKEAFVSQLATETAWSEPPLSVPESYDLDMLRAMIQDPSHIFVYWELRRRTLDALSRYFSVEEAATFRPALRVIDTGSRDEGFFTVEEQGNYWVEVAPGREYEFEIGVRSLLHGYIAIVRSNRVRTPQAAISLVAPSESGYGSEIREFIEVAEASGFSAEPVLRAPAPETDDSGEDNVNELSQGPSSDEMIRSQ